MDPSSAFRQIREFVRKQTGSLGVTFPDPNHSSTHVHQFRNWTHIVTYDPRYSGSPRPFLKYESIETEEWEARVYPNSSIYMIRGTEDLLIGDAKMLLVHDS